jgi:hypothetical protein
VNTNREDASNGTHDEFSAPTLFISIGASSISLCKRVINMRKKYIRKGKLVDADKLDFHIALGKDVTLEIGKMAKNVWEMCDGKTTKEEIVEKFTQDTLLKKQEMGRTIDTILERLVSIGLVERLED